MGRRAGTGALAKIEYARDRAFAANKYSYKATKQRASKFINKFYTYHLTYFDNRDVLMNTTRILGVSTGHIPTYVSGFRTLEPCR